METRHLSPSTLPPANVYEGNGFLSVAIPVPGAHADTIEATLTGRRLTVKAEGRYAQEQQHYLLHEWQVGAFERQLELPKPVRSQEARATLSHGILTVMMPLSDTEEPGSVRIEVDPH